LPPYAANLRKRLVKSPKVYWRDSGLLHALLGCTGRTDLWAQPWVGSSWEGWVIEQILAVRQGRGESVQPFFFRSQDGLEADLVLEAGKQREVLEIKLTTAPAPEDITRLARVAQMIGATRQVLISRTRQAVFQGKSWSASVGAYLQKTADE
jgi:hypothetical protein